jgi:hypothetical protein
MLEGLDKEAYIHTSMPLIYFIQMLVEDTSRPQSCLSERGHSHEYRSWHQLAVGLLGLSTPPVLDLTLLSCLRTASDPLPYFCEQAPTAVP